ncbi:unnamed protein product [Meganyctiphanes norvegica]|uniref:C2H2-type domain-containing protein n=1 Tax=Meganyctiphanes norvegica TaxID=48144 RepID=A0AAV2RCW7_MEGNR
MEPATVQNATGMIWYGNYNTADGIITTTAPVQVELGSVDIARQINQQVHIQYGQLQAVQNAQPQQIVITTHQPQIQAAPLSPEQPHALKVAKSRSRPTNGERVPCQECGKTFSCNANLRDHMRLHTGERPFICGECGMSFAQRSNWRLHKRVHTGERPYMCGICGKTFSRSSHLPGHMRVHTGERPYQCEQCDHAFASQQALKNHARTHSGEKPFVCEYCDTAFTHSSSLSSHKKRCTGEKRKRGRPLGSGRKSYRKKSTGRPRGRPRKKARFARKGRKRTIVKEEGSEGYENGNESSEFVVKNSISIKAEIHMETGEDPLAVHTINPKKEKIDGMEVEQEPPVVEMQLEQQGNEPILTESIPTVVFSNNSNEAVTVTSAETGVEQQTVQPTDVVHIAAAAAGVDETTNLHQEAAVAMAALHEGSALNLAQHQLPEGTYFNSERTDNNPQAMTWYPKQQQ